MARESNEAALDKVSERQRRLLERWVSKVSGTPHRLRERCQVALLSVRKLSSEEQARRLGIDSQRVRRWRTCWSEAQRRLAAAEAESATDGDLAKVMKEVLSDSPRPGGPLTFTAEQVAQVISLPCEPTADHGLPTSHWTPRELAAVAMARGIVDSISKRQVGRF